MTVTITAVETAFQSKTRLVQLSVKVTASDGSSGLGNAAAALHRRSYQPAQGCGLGLPERH